jgi:hypothetical protein
VRARRGTVLVPAGGAALSHYYPGLTRVRIGSVVTNGTTPGRVDVRLAAGIHRFERLTDDNIFLGDLEA